MTSTRRKRMFKTGIFLMFVVVGLIAVVGGAGIGGAWDAGSGIGLLFIIAGLVALAIDSLWRERSLAGTTTSPTEERDPSADPGTPATRAP